MRFLSSLILCYSWMKSCITCPAHQMKSNMSILPQHYQHQKVIILLKLLGYKNICLIRKKVRALSIIIHISGIITRVCC
ncbi:unnamed protein product [Acanthoscelides obtectus]|uniref:Secreted protein n=1 Tax=Acanthoscelides obtectus TaxID=200917 RepID=A0A9P0KYV4_ACAOB|nr:unnamed protein product [Acanthoscelides obtectus]CAK1656098.1 hypothetical protein AOBTE_LOCUS19570 [Acanthoscelides obtectus]